MARLAAEREMPDECKIILLKQVLNEETLLQEATHEILYEGKCAIRQGVKGSFEETDVQGNFVTLKNLRIKIPASVAKTVSVEGEKRVEVLPNNDFLVSRFFRVVGVRLNSAGITCSLNVEEVIL